VLEPIFTQIGRVIELIGTNLGNLGRVIGAVLEPFGVIVQGIAQAFEPLNDAALNFFKAISDGAVAATEFVVSFTPVGLVADNMGVISETLSRIITIITTAFAKAGEYVANLAGQFGELVASTPLLSTLGDVASAVFGTIATVIGNLVSGIGEFVGNLLTIAEYWLGIEESTKKTAAATVAVSESTAEVSKEAQKAIEEREKTFQRLREEVNNAIDDSRKFGAAGREAALQYEASIEQLKKRLSAGIIDEEQFRRSVRMAGQAFDDEIKAIEDRSKLEIKVKENAEKAIEKVADQIDKAAIKAEDFGKAGDRALAQFAGRADSLKLQFSAGLIDEKQLEQGVAAANREYDKQIEKIKQANTERQKQIEDDRKRSDSLLDEMDKTRAVQRDREAVEREVARVRQEAAANGFFTPEQRQQLLDLQKLQGDLAEKQRAVAQGFEKGYAEAFDKTRDKFDSLIVKSEEFGAAGQEAAQRLASGLTNAAQLAERGAIGEEAYQREVARQERLYEKEIEGLKKAADERLKVNEAVDQILLLQSVNGDSQRAEAKKQVLAIEQEIARVQEEIAAAREADDTEAVNAGAARLAQLDQAAAKERDIASGAAKQREDFQKQSEKQLESQSKAQQQYAQQQTKIFEEQQKAAAAEAKRQEERLAKLNTLGAQTIKSQDVRTTEGASLVLQTIASGQDPALIQQRLQTKYLEAIAAGIGQASSNYFNQPVAIVGYSSFGQR
jgi:epidermal growth factor receptor substrate 15